jgi:hypothetical protein
VGFIGLKEPMFPPVEFQDISRRPARSEPQLSGSKTVRTASSSARPVNRPPFGNCHCCAVVVGSGGQQQAEVRSRLAR